jgi:hypothetical protein
MGHKKVEVSNERNFMPLKVQIVRLEWIKYVNKTRTAYAGADDNLCEGLGVQRISSRTAGAHRRMAQRHRCGLLGHDAAGFIRFAFRVAAIVPAEAKPHAIARCNPCPGAPCSNLSTISVRTFLVAASRTG